MRFFFLFLFFAFLFSDSEISFRSEPNFLPPPATFIVVAAIGGAVLPGKLAPQRYRLYQLVSAVVIQLRCPLSYRYYAAAVGKTANPAISKSFTPHKSNHRRHHHHGEEEQGRGQGPVPAIRDGQ